MLPILQIALVPEVNADTQDGCSQMPPVQTTLEEKSKHDVSNLSLSGAA